MALIQQYGDIAEIYRLLPDIEAKPAAIKKLEAGRDMAEMSYRLAAIVTDAPLPFDPAENLRKPVTADLYPLFLKLEFTKLIEKMGLTGDAAPAAEENAEVTGTCESEIVTDPARAEALLALWRQRPFVACLALPGLEGVCVEWGDKACGRAALFLAGKLEGYNDFLRSFFSAEIQKVSHNVKDLTRELLAENLPAEGFLFDAAIAGYLLDATAGHYDVNRLSVSWLGAEAAKPLYLEEGALTGMGAPDPEALGAWMGHTALIAALYEKMAPKLEAMGMTELFEKIEMPLCRVLAEMELAGFLVDAKALQEMGEVLSAAIAGLEEQIYAHAGKFNINSPKQLGEVLFERLGLPAYKKTKTGYSTNAEVLEKLRFQHPIVDQVLQYRQYAKLKSTYVDGLLKVIGPDGRVRTSFQMTVTATGRLSSTEPNLQNIPTRTELGSELRRMFVAGPGMVLVDADYSQIELRLLAHISGDETMRNAFRTGEDIHTITASQVFGVTPEEVTPLMRRSAKAVNFGIVYGISSFSLSQDIGVTVAEAKDYMDSYFAKYPGVKRYMEEIVERAKAEGYVETLYHRRRALPEIKSSNFNMRAFGERVALNMPIQGTAADIMKLAMVHVSRRLKAEGLKARLLMQVHDELIVECPEAEADQVKTLLTEEMEQVCRLSVPLTAEAHSGRNWLEAK